MILYSRTKIINRVYFMYKLINFKELVLKNTRNQYLVLPKNFISKSKPNLISPVFKCNVNELQSVFIEFINSQNRIRNIVLDKKNYKFSCIQSTRVFRFPDIIDFEFLSINIDYSSVAIYSRSRYGYYDFNVNKRRVMLWLDEISRNISIDE